MLEAGEVGAGDSIVEIGPGFGVLTFALVERGVQLVAYEIEKKLQPYWEERSEDQKIRRSGGSIDLIWGNFLRNSRFQILDSKFKKFKVVANLPYQITSKILRTLLESEHKPERIVVMVQKEVAQRIVATPGEMSMLALSVQYYGEPKIITKVPKGSFWPAPKVDSAVLAITNIQPRKNEKAFFAVAKAGFANKRKQLWRNLSSGLGWSAEQAKQIVAAATGNEKIRAQELSIEEWEKIGKYVNNPPPSPLP